MSDRKLPVERELEIKLTDEQLVAVSAKAVELQEMLLNVEKEKKTLVSDFNAQIKALKLAVARECHNYTMGTECKLVECIQHFDLKSSTTWAEYEGEKYDIVEMTEEEIADTQQGELFDASVLGAGDSVGGEMLSN